MRESHSDDGSCVTLHVSSADLVDGVVPLLLNQAALNVLVLADAKGMDRLTLELPPSLYCQCRIVIKKIDLGSGCILLKVKDPKNLLDGSAATFPRPVCHTPLQAVAVQADAENGWWLVT